MKNEDYDKIRCLLEKINRLSNQADCIKSAIDNLKKCGDEMQLHISSKKEMYEISLPTGMSEKVLLDVLEMHYDIIRKTKNEIDTIIDNEITAKVY